MQRPTHIRTDLVRSPVAISACALALAGVLLVPAAGAQSRRPSAAAPPPESATLEQCVTSVVQSERSATFAGEMSAVAGTTRMEMRIAVLERRPDQAAFRTVTAAAGAWRFSDPKIRVYKYLKQVTNLSSPAVYRALVRFRWLGAKGRVVKRAQLLTAPCAQPAAPLPAPATS